MRGKQEWQVTCTPLSKALKTTQKMTTQAMTRSQLAKERKDALVDRVLNTARNLNEEQEKTLAAAVIGGITGTLLGLALSSM